MALSAGRASRGVAKPRGGRDDDDADAGGAWGSRKASIPAVLGAAAAETAAAEAEEAAGLGLGITGIVRCATGPV